MTVHVIGIGSEHGADRLGLAVVDYLERTGAAGRGVCLHRCHAPGRELRALLHGAPAVILIDAVRGPGAPGTVLHPSRHDLARLPAAASTHEMGVAELLALMEALSELPPWLHIVGVNVGERPSARLPGEWVRAGAGAVCALLRERRNPPSAPST